MNHPNSYLIFRINDTLYGVSTYLVKEIFLLPEYKPMPDAPQGVIGVIDVRGQLLPLMDLNSCFAPQTNRYALTDHVIVVEQEEQALGIIVNVVDEVRNIAETDLDNQVKYGQQLTGIASNPFISGVVKSDRDIIAIIDLANLIGYVFGTSDRESSQVPLGFLTGSDLEASPEQSIPLQLTASPNPDSQSQLTSEALTVLRERANLLRQADRSRQNFQNARNLAIVALSNELFSVDLENVREFTNIEQVVPVPCCPPHIIGNMNLRGEVLTLVDICQLLNLPPINLTKVSQLMVVEIDRLRVGLAIEKVHDTIIVDAHQIDAVPAANYSAGREYYQGTLGYQQRTISILDIAKMLRNGNLIVDWAG